MERSTRATPEEALVREINSELRRRENRRLSKGELQAAARWDWIPEALHIGTLASVLADEVITWREEPDVVSIPADDPGAIGTLEEAERARGWAVSLRVAERASELAEVREFRRRHLPAGLIPWDDLERWLRDRAEPLARVTRVLMDPLAAGVEISGAGSGYQTGLQSPIRGIEQSFERRLVQVVQRDGSRSNVPLRTGPIADADLLVEYLMEHTLWDRPQAFVWLFTGDVPDLPLLQVRYWKAPYDPNPWRVQVTADADVDPRDVAAAFRAARRRTLGTRAPTMGRRAWVATAWYLRHPTGTWNATMRSFNASNPDDAFYDRRRFAATIRRAQARLPMRYSWSGRWSDMPVVSEEG